MFNTFKDPIKCLLELYERKEVHHQWWPHAAAKCAAITLNLKAFAFIPDGFRLMLMSWRCLWFVREWGQIMDSTSAKLKSQTCPSRSRCWKSDSTLFDWSFLTTLCMAEQTWLPFHCSRFSRYLFRLSCVWPCVCLRGALCRDVPRSVQMSYSSPPCRWRPARPECEGEGEGLRASEVTLSLTWAFGPFPVTKRCLCFSQLVPVEPGDRFPFFLFNK